MEILKLWVVTSCTVADRNMQPYLQGRRWRWAPSWQRKCSNSSFLPRTPSAFQQAKHRALHRSFLLGCAVIFGYKTNDGLQYSGKASCPWGEGADE